MTYIESSVDSLRIYGIVRLHRNHFREKGATYFMILSIAHEEWHIPGPWSSLHLDVVFWAAVAPSVPEMALVYKSLGEGTVVVFVFKIGSFNSAPDGHVRIIWMILCVFPDRTCPIILSESSERGVQRGKKLKNLRRFISMHLDYQ